MYISISHLSINQPPKQATASDDHLCVRRPSSVCTTSIYIHSQYMGMYRKIYMHKNSYTQTYFAQRYIMTKIKKEIHNAATSMQLTDTSTIVLALCACLCLPACVAASVSGCKFKDNCSASLDVRSFVRSARSVLCTSLLISFRALVLNALFFLLAFLCIEIDRRACVSRDSLVYFICSYLFFKMNDHDFDSHNKC